MNRARRLFFGSISSLAACLLLHGVSACAESEPEPVVSNDAGSSPEATVVPGPDASTTCGDGGLCRVALPDAKPISLNGVWGTSADDVWIVGSPDTVLHWDGHSLIASKTDSGRALMGIWGSGASDVWTFSAGDALWHSDGFRDGETRWSAYAGVADGGTPWTNAVTAMWGTSSNDVWAVGPWVEMSGAPTVWHCDGWHDGILSWVAPSMPDRPDLPGAYFFNAIWGKPGADVWFVGGGGKTRYTSGWKGTDTSFTAVDSATSLELHAVWGSGEGEVWAAGAAGVMRRFVRAPDGTFTATAVEFPAPVTIRSLFGFSASDIWAVGAKGMIAHWDGTVWSLVAEPADDAGQNDLFAVWGTSPDDIWVVGQNTLLHSNHPGGAGTKP